MPDPETYPETTDHPAADPSPGVPTISVTRHLEPPQIAPKSEANSDPTARQTYHPTPTDATPVISGPGDTDAPTRMQDVKTVFSRPKGVPDIPGYEIIAEIGRGGMGVVYKARQLDLNRPVALKMILGEYERPEQLIRFRLEAETAARVRHTNVVQVYDSGTFNGRPYLVLEWVEGGTLSKYLKGKVQPPRASARTISLLARAMHATHCAGIVHRDLKPGNILVSNIVASNATTQTGSGASRPDALGVTLSVDGQAFPLVPKVTDFGLAKEMTSDTHLTETGRVLGTPEYMAPEQAKGQHRAVGPCTDIYALGVILYQMLTDRTPFHDKSVVAVMRRVVEEEPKPPRAHQPKVPRDLETICLKCLQKDPMRRYATADALANDLDNFLEGRPIAARPTGNLERAWKWAARRPAVAACAAAAVLFFALGFAGVTWQWRATVAQRDRAESAEHQVRTEKAVTDAVNRFLLDDLLATASPEKQLDHKVTVEEVLKNASAGADGRFADQPEVAAAVRVVLGNSYRKLGLFEPANRYLSTGLDLRKKTLGATHRDTLSAAADRGLLLADVRKWDEAVPLLRQVVSDTRDKLGPDDSLTIESTGRLAWVLQEQGNTSEAEGLYKQALDAGRRVLGADDPKTLTVLNDYGTLLHARKRLPEAEAAFREAVDGRVKAFAQHHPAVLESRQNLAVVLDDEGRWAEAKPLLESVLEDKRRILGPEHIDTLSDMNNLARLLSQHGQADAALLLFGDAVDGFRKALGKDNPLTLRVQNNLGEFAYRMGLQTSNRELLARAESVLAANLEARRRVLPPDHPETLQSANNLAVLFIALRRLDDAEPLIKEALAGRRKILGNGQPETLKTVDNYAQFLRDRRRVPEATAECEQALDAAAKAKTTENPTAIGLLCTLVELLAVQTSRLPDALTRAEQAAALTRKVHGENHKETLRALRALGTVLTRLNRPADAEAHLRSVYNSTRSSLGVAHPQTARDAGKLGACLFAQKRYADAEPLLIQCYDGVRGIQGAPKDQVQAYGEAVVKLYEEWGKPEKAAEWRETLR